MSLKVSKREVKKNFANVVCVGANEMPRMMALLPKFAHTESEAGWDADIHLVNEVSVIVTGYRAFGKMASSHKAEMFEEAAKAAWNDCQAKGATTEAYIELYGCIRHLAEMMVNEVMEDIDNE